MLSTHISPLGCWEATSHRSSLTNYIASCTSSPPKARTQTFSRLKESSFTTFLSSDQSIPTWLSIELITSRNVSRSSITSSAALFFSSWRMWRYTRMSMFPLSLVFAYLLARNHASRTSSITATYTDTWRIHSKVARLSVVVHLDRSVLLVVSSRVLFIQSRPSHDTLGKKARSLGSIIA